MLGSGLGLELGLGLWVSPTPSEQIPENDMLIMATRLLSRQAKQQKWKGDELCVACHEAKLL